MRKHIGISLFFYGVFPVSFGYRYLVATNADDSNAGTLDKPFCHLTKSAVKKPFRRY